MKKIVIFLALLLIIPASASILSDSYKIFSYDADYLFLNAIGALSSSNRFEISEIQTKNGYILFKYGAKYFLLTLTKRYKNQTEIKILPQNSDFSDEAEVAKMVFSLIDYQLKFNPVGSVK